MMSKTKRWLAMWDCYGLEYLYNLSEFEESQTWSVLMEEESPITPPTDIRKLILRAQFNEQRNYEVYVFEADSSIDKKSLEYQFKHMPQAIVDLIRNQGFKIYDGKRTRDPVIS
jgi:hypothetical protein